MDGVFPIFLMAQATAMFGGHDYLEQTTGLTYAEYVHEGFGQLTVATMLTLTVVAWAARQAEPGRRRDVALGALCVMTVVVVVVLVIAAGVVGTRHWLVPVAVRLGAAGLLGLALVNPDLYIAQHNIARCRCHARHRLDLPERAFDGCLSGPGGPSRRAVRVCDPLLRKAGR